MKKRRIIIAVISIIVVAAMVLFDMLYMKKDKKEELPQEEKKVEEIVWITESSIEGVQSEMEEALKNVDVNIKYDSYAFQWKHMRKMLQNI